MKNKVANLSRNLLMEMARKVAVRDANTSCPFLSYQPKMSGAVKALKK